MNETEISLQIWQSALQAHEFLWAVYLLTLAGVVAMALWQREKVVSRLHVGVIVLVLICIWITNAWAIYDNLQTYNAAASVLRDLQVVQPIRKIDAGHLVIMHVLLDGCALAMWLLRRPTFPAIGRQ